MKKVFILCLLAATNLFSQTSFEMFKNANALYQKEKYGEAIKLYDKIEAKNTVSSELYHNLGNCYYKLNKVAPAIYNYERALKLDASNEDARNNLVFAKRLTLDRIETLPKSMFQKFSENYLQQLNYNTWAKIAVFFSILTAVLFLLFYFAVIPSKKRLYFTASCISFILFVGILLITNNQFNTSKNTIEAIVFSGEVSIKSEPTKSSSELYSLHEGTKIKIIDTVDDWKKIKLPDGKTGWLKTKDVKEI